MLLHFLALNLLDDLEIDVLIRACILGVYLVSESDRIVIKAISIPIENLKNMSYFFDISLDIALACAIDGREVNGDLVITTSG